MSKFSKDNQPINKGRKKGSVNKITQLLRDATPEILVSLIEQAKAGDIQSAQLILKHTLTPLKAEYRPLTINFKEGMTWQEKAEALANSALNGECCPSMAISMINVLGNITKSVSLDVQIQSSQKGENERKRTLADFYKDVENQDIQTKVT